MTEEDWLASVSPRAMLEFVCSATISIRTRWHGDREAKRFTLSRRKVQLTACACCARVVDRLPGPAHRRLLSVAEQQADGGADAEVVDRALGRANREWDRYQQDYAPNDPEQWSVLGSRAAVLACLSVAPYEVFDYALRAFHPLSASAIERERAEMADLVREVIGNPFRSEPMEPAWRAAEGGVVMRLARTIYDERAYHDLPVLADALEDAGCTSEAILTHCRAGGPHVRGCWALDRVLALE